MLQNAATVRGGATVRPDRPTPQRTGEDGGRGVTRLSGGTARTGQIGHIVMNPLHGGAASTATHYLDRNNQVQPRSITPLAYDAASLRQDTGRATSWGSIKNAVPFLGRTTYGAILKGAERFENAPGLSGAARETQLTALKKDIDAWQAKAWRRQRACCLAQGEGDRPDGGRGRPGAGRGALRRGAGEAAGQAAAGDDDRP